MSEILNSTGGASASPIVKAVLGNIGRRYLVEHWESEDKLLSYDRYSDGYIEQRGFITAESGTTDIVFPMEFRDINYSFNMCYKTNSGGSSGSWAPREIMGTRQTTGLTVFHNGGVSQGSSANWEAKGYTA